MRTFSKWRGRVWGGTRRSFFKKSSIAAAFTVVGVTAGAPVLSGAVLRGDAADRLARLAIWLDRSLDQGQKQRLAARVGNSQPEPPDLQAVIAADYRSGQTILVNNIMLSETEAGYILRSNGWAKA